MSEKKLWVISSVYLNGIPDEAGVLKDMLCVDFKDVIEATEEEVKELLEADWNPKCIKDPRTGEIHRHFEAYKQRIHTADHFKEYLKYCDYPVE